MLVQGILIWFTEGVLPEHRRDRRLRLHLLHPCVNQLCIACPPSNGRCLFDSLVYSDSSSLAQCDKSFQTLMSRISYYLISQVSERHRLEVGTPVSPVRWISILECPNWEMPLFSRKELMISRNWTRVEI